MSRLKEAIAKKRDRMKFYFETVDDDFLQELEELADADVDEAFEDGKHFAFEAAVHTIFNLPNALVIETELRRIL